jgi:cell division transport system permease protein
MSTLWRILKYGVQGFRRNIWLSVIAVITMSLTLAMISIFFVGDIVATKQYQELNQKIDYVVFLNDSASDADVTLLRDQINDQPEVQSSVYYSKNQVRLKFENEFGQVSAFKGIITSENNPLPREIDVKFFNPQQIDIFDKFVNQARFSQIVENTSYSYQANHVSIENYVHTTNMLKIFGLFLTGFFVIIAVLVILNTIRMAIYSRREEIEIMRLVGATHSYIRGPFLVEGVFFGLIGAAITALMSWILLHQLQKVLADSLKFGTTNFINDLFGSSLNMITKVSGFNSFFSQLAIMQIVVGILLGVSCSYLAARRYLKE